MQNDPPIPDEKMHVGHRNRMREKFLAHGAAIFDTYELLEMLLYYTIPYKDTNPIAKRLLAEFGSLDGVFSASSERLAAVSGIGARTAELIVAAGRMSEALYLDSSEEVTVYDDYDIVGRRFVEYFKGCKSYSIAMLMLDNSMRERGIVTLFEDMRYSSAAVTDYENILCSSSFLENSGSLTIIGLHHQGTSPQMIQISDRLIQIMDAVLTIK